MNFMPRILNLNLEELHAVGNEDGSTDLCKIKLLAESVEDRGELLGLDRISIKARLSLSLPLHLPPADHQQRLRQESQGAFVASEISQNKYSGERPPRRRQIREKVLYKLFL